MLDEIEDILSIRIFGSAVRGDSDEGSDIDVLVVTDNPGNALQKVAKYFLHQKNMDFSIYSQERIEKMFDEGHLFAWHLYLESVSFSPEFDDKWFNELKRPSNYKDALFDLSQFLILLEESISSVKAGSDYIFEAGICHLGLRNCAMIIKYIETGTPNFSRYSVLELSDALKFEMKKDDYNALLRCRRISARGNLEVPPSKNEVLKALIVIENWIKVVRSNFNV